ncbi:MAG: hypothetical protein Q8S03_18055 [Brevundimonas sp.]|uniref:hypothetical protein n=1 Tax=Brevundimonas sp. TaxID=1871086 RepID=UPI002732465C|nr:hypothetical protein [Brevundimonas sp.]MDP3406598.1 hypothetical protein [Brevundimonas sp.]
MNGDRHHRSGRIDFAKVNAVAQSNSDAVVRALLPDGRREGAEWVARNPVRSDHRPGSFKVNLTTGKWADFSSGDRGGDLVSLVALIAALPQREAAIRLAETLGINPFEGGDR